MCKAATWLAALLAACAMGAPSHAAPAGDPSGGVAPDAIYVRGKVLSMDPQHRQFEAMAVRGGLIVALGTSRQLLRLRGAGTTVHDLRGRTVLPGFIDAHGHFPASAISRDFFVELGSPPLGTVRNIGELLDRLAARERTLPAGVALQGAGYDDTLLAEKRHPTRSDLDRVSRDRPIYITHVSGHLAVANSAALALGGIGPSTAAPTGGRIVLDAATGEPTGLLEESAMGLVSAKLPRVSAGQMHEAIRAASREYAEAGVTTAQNGAANAEFIQQALQAIDDGSLGPRLNVWLAAPTVPLFQKGAALVPQGQDRLAVTGVKLFADGSIQGYTGFLTRPYFRQRAGADADYRGYPRLEREKLTAQIVELQRGHVRVAVHANGDAAIDDVIAAMAEAGRQAPWPQARHVMVHAQMAREDQLDRMREIGVLPSFFIGHTYFWGDRHRDIFIGPERAARISPARSALSRGIRFTLHADTPVTPMRPLQIVWSAVNRVTSGDRVLGAAQRIPVIDALEAVTIDAAWQEGQEATRGSLEPGKFADFIVLDRNPLTVAPARIRDLVVMQTVVGGRTVFCREATDSCAGDGRAGSAREPIPSSSP